MYNPKKQFTVPLLLYAVTGKEKVNGMVQKVYADTPELFYGSFATYGGTETEKNGVLAIEDTAQIETYYHPGITSDCKIQNAETKKEYEILGEPEDIEQRHLLMKFKVRRLKGGR